MNRMNLTAFRIARVTFVTAKAAMMEGREFICRMSSNVFYLLVAEFPRESRAVAARALRRAQWVTTAGRAPGMYEHAQDLPAPMELPTRRIPVSNLPGLTQARQMLRMGPFRWDSCLESLRLGPLVATMIMTAINGWTPAARLQAIPVRAAARKVRKNLH